MNNLKKVEEMKNAHVLKVMQLDNTYQTAFNNFFANDDPTKSYEEQLVEFEDLWERRVELDYEAHPIQSFFSHIIGDLENLKIGMWDKLLHKSKVKQMKRKIKGQLVLDEVEEVVEPVVFKPIDTSEPIRVIETATTFVESDEPEIKESLSNKVGKIFKKK